MNPSRRLLGIGLATLFVASLSCCSNESTRFEIAVFFADVTPPLGHILFTGGVRPAEAVDDPLHARGFVLLHREQNPVVFVAIDWAEIRNDAHDRWRESLAAAAKTTPDRVLVSSVHQHDTPLADLEAQRILSESGSTLQLIDPVFHEDAIARTAAALKNSLEKSHPVTHIGIGEAEVDRIASNRRFVTPGGAVDYGRMSRTQNLTARNAPEGTVDPMLKTLSFWNGRKPLAALSVYATHPMSYYRTGRVSADFPGIARARRQSSIPGVFQIYASGASGNVTAGKYNDGSPEARAQLAERLLRGMNDAWAATRRVTPSDFRFASVDLHLAPRSSPGFTPAELNEKLADPANPKNQGLAALGLSWNHRLSRNPSIDIPMIDFGPAQLVLLPGEIYVEYQLFAQDLRPDSFVVTAGYGECAPGYIPIERAWREKDRNLNGWCWIDPGAEDSVREALTRLLTPD